VAYTAGNQAVALYLTPAVDLKPGERAVVCGSRAVFEETTGGARNAKHVYAADESPGSYVVASFTAYGSSSPYTYRINLDQSSRAAFSLNPTSGYLFMAPSDLHGINGLDCVKWGSNIALPSGLNSTDVATYYWNGAPVVVTGVEEGHSIRRSPTGGGAGTNGQDSNTAADWIEETYPRPADKFAANQFEWLAITLPEHTSTLAESVAAGATALKFEEGTTGWSPTGDGVIEGDSFAYTGRSAEQLTGVTGLGSSHVQGAAAWPYANGRAQTGWRVTTIKLRRRQGNAYLKRWEIWLSELTAPDTPDGQNPSDIQWRADYSAPHLAGTNGDPVVGIGRRADIVVQVAPDAGARWARVILINILDMWAQYGETTGARAKLNEVEVQIDAATINASGVADVDGATAGQVAAWLVDTYTWLARTDFQNRTGLGWGDLGNLALAIAPLPGVLEDLARAHGCIVRYDLNGRIYWDADPWWPGSMPFHPDCAGGPLYKFGPTSVRGEVRVDDANQEISGVALSATDTEGNPLERVSSPPGVSGSGVRELTGYTVANQDTAQLLAAKLELRERVQTRATWTVAGVGEWCRPGQIVYLEWPPGRHPETWLVERVTWQWAGGGGRGKTWQAQLDCRKVWAG
jgi:hypothetical protein